MNSLPPKKGDGKEWVLKKFVDPVCWEPNYEPDGGLIAGKHSPDKDGYCNGCGMAIYEKVLLERFHMSDTDLLQLVMDGMGWEKKKAQKWFNVPNPLLGGATPNGFELMRGKMKLEKFIRDQLSLNKPRDGGQGE